MKYKVFLFLLFGVSLLKSQINYNFTPVGGAYAANATPTVIHTAGTDDALSAAINIGFTFQFGCVNYTQIDVSSNGWLTFNTGATGSNAFNDLTGIAAINRPLIAPLWDDLAVGSGGTVNYQVTGVAPNRVMTVEWNQMEWNWAASTWGISFQAKLFETTNRIEFHYLRNGNATANLNGPSASIGLAGATVGDFYSLDAATAAPNASKLVETTNLNSKPPNSQIYRWDPVNCTAPPVAGTAVGSPSTACATYTTALSLTGNSSGCGMTYQWQSAPALAGPYTNITGATNSSTVVTVSSTTYYRCVLTCGGFTAASTPATCILVATGACGICNIINVASLPYTHVGQTTCGAGNDVTSANVTNVCGSTFYYGGEDVVYSFVPTSSGVITLSVTSGGTYMGLMLYNGCPISGGTCVGSSQSSAGNQSICVNVVSGQTYYVVIDSWPSPTCNPYNLGISAPGACAGALPSTTAVASPTSACGTLITNLSLSPAVGLCGVSFQWQSASALAGPYTNILGATNASQSATTTASVFYRCVLTCGASTLASAAVQVSVFPSPTVACALSTYTAATTTYSFEVFAGTLLPTTDDVLFNNITMFGFPFCYGGSQYWGGYAASNSSFVFDGVPCYPNIQSGTAYASGGAWTGYSISGPAPSNNQSVPMNAILGPWHDIDPSISGTIRYYTAGTAPNRRFVLSFENIPMYSCGTSSPSIYFRGQIKLFETSNIIEIHIANKGVCPFNNGQAIMGLHGYDGTSYVPPVNMTAHNATAGPPYNTWTMTNTAYRFNSPCAASGPCVVLPLGFISFTGENQENKNHLNWKVEGNANFNRFVIERSLDGVNFSEIATVSSSAKLEYSYDDDSFKPFVINYYRISGIGKNNEVSKTAIVPVGSKSDDFEIGNLFPNPTEKGFAVQINSKLVQPMQMTICNALGVEVHKEMITSQLGYSTHQFKTNNLPAGLYIVKFHNKENQKLNEQKLVIGKGQ